MAGLELARDELVEAGFELVAVVGEDALEAPARLRELGGDPPGELGGLLCAWVTGWADDQIGPAVARVDVDRGQLPDIPVGALQATDLEAVDADQFAGRLNG